MPNMVHPNWTCTSQDDNWSIMVDTYCIWLTKRANHKHLIQFQILNLLQKIPNPLQLSFLSDNTDYFFVNLLKFKVEINTPKWNDMLKNDIMSFSQKSPPLSQLLDENIKFQSDYI